MAYLCKTCEKIVSGDGGCPYCGAGTAGSTASTEARELKLGIAGALGGCLLIMAGAAALTAAGGRTAIEVAGGIGAVVGVIVVRIGSRYLRDSPRAQGALAFLLVGGMLSLVAAVPFIAGLVRAPRWIGAIPGAIAVMVAIICRDLLMARK